MERCFASGASTSAAAHCTRSARRATSSGDAARPTSLCGKMHNVIHLMLGRVLQTWMDDWISGVYGADRTLRGEVVEVVHHTGKHGQRYGVDKSSAAPASRFFFSHRGASSRGARRHACPPAGRRRGAAGAPARRPRAPMSPGRLLAALYAPTSQARGAAQGPPRRREQEDPGLRRQVQRRDRAAAAGLQPLPGEAAPVRFYSGVFRICASATARFERGRLT